MKSLARKFAHWCGLFVVDPSEVLEWTKDASVYLKAAQEASHRNAFYEEGIFDGKAAGINEVCHKIRKANTP